MRETEMREVEELSLPEFRTSASGGRDASTDGQEIEDAEQTDSRQLESKRTKLCVLIGSGILQLPIWGFAMSYGVFQEYYFDNWTLEGDRSTTGVIGTTANGVMYLSMPFLFALFTRHWAHRRQLAALCGTVIACVSFFLSAYSTAIWHLVLTQGITSALGCALIYSPTTLSLGEWYTSSNRALAYGIVLSCKNIVGTSCPFMLRALIDAYGYKTTLMAWTAIVGGTSIIAIFLVPTHPSKVSIDKTRARKIPWHFLRHRSIYFYSIAIIFQSSGYGIPQTYLSTYARDITLLSQTSGTLMLALFNAPGIVASAFFGWLSDNKRIRLSAQSVAAIPPVCSALATFLFWGLTTQGGIGLLILFSITFGFFSSGYSATWGGILKQMESESAERNEAVDPGMLYGLLNGVRGIGYASGGVASVGLLNAGTIAVSQRFGYGTIYGPLILFTGLSSLLGGWVVLWRWNPKRLLPLVSGR
ncbi:putative monocarboxylate transporter [Biscogniauxia mediterranea]|nr:putative monocarboxylate transporter [Biscogniauxia mediterranea]